MKYKVLLIGLGQVGMGYDFKVVPSLSLVLTHARAFSMHQNFTLVGGVDPDPGCRDRFVQGYRASAYDDLATALKQTQPDVVVIASPTQYHLEAIQAALSHAKPKLILCEKPLAYDLAEARAMIETCKDAGCLLYVNYLRRVEPGAIEIKQRLMDGRIATPVKGVAWYSKGLLHNGSHFSNLLEFWLGPVMDFKLISPGRLWQGTDPEPDVQITFASGEVIFLAAKEENFSHHEIQLVAPNGCLRYEQGGRRIIWQSLVPDPDVEDYRVLSTSGEQIISEGNKLQWLVADNVIACLRGMTSNLCTGEDALRTLESLLKIKAAL